MLFSLLPLALAATPPGLDLARPPCGTPGMLRALGPATRMHVAPPGAEKVARDAYGTFPNELVGENFIVKWGNTGRADTRAVQSLLAAFEDAWAVEIEEMGMPVPNGADGTLFNVYIGDTGSGTPDGYGASGYYTRDAQDYPMIVVSLATLDDEAWATGTATHEFFHALQDATARYSYEDDSAWYWEATAMWIEGEVLPDQDEYVSFLFGYALLPQLPVYFFDYPDTGALQEYHQYGAMIFPRYISEIAADWEVVRDSWTEPLGAETPQEALALLLEERGIAFADAFGDFAARNATWDYADGEIYQLWVDYYADYYRSDDHRVVAEVEYRGTDGVVAAPEDTLPGRFAYNVVTLPRPVEAGLTVRFEGAAEGSKGSAPDWRVTVVREPEAGGPTYVPMTLEGGVGELTFTDVGDEVIHLVAAAVPEDARSDETFSWSYGFTPEEIAPEPEPDPDTAAPGTDEPEEESPAACGCASGTGGSSASGLLMIAALATAARRRR